jgi:hypothetical protein
LVVEEVILGGSPQRRHRTAISVTSVGRAIV